MAENRSGYDMDNEEYRALFRRIEDSSKRFAQDEERTKDIKRGVVNGVDRFAGMNLDEQPLMPERPRKPVRASDSTKSEASQKQKPVRRETKAGKIADTAKKTLQGGAKKLNTTKDGKKIPLLKGLYRLSAVLFAAILVLFGFVSAVDKNKTVSKEENRKLAEKPKFSFSSLFKGEYTVDFENFYSDNFPARSFFMSCSNKINDVFTRFSGGSDEVMISTEKKDEDFVGEGVDLLGEKKQGMKENTAEVAPDSEASIRGSILIAGNRALEMYYHNQEKSKNYADMLNRTAAAMPNGVKFYSMLCPTAIEFYGTAQYREGVHSQRDSIQKTYDMLSDSIIKVDVYSNLVDNVKDYIYFRSDHHWTARGAYCGYKAFCDVSGNTATPLESFATHKLDGFLGSLYKASQQAQVLADNPDYVECFDLSVDVQNTVYPNTAMNPTDGVSTYVVAREVNDSNKYLAFIAGDQPLEKIVTSVKNGKKILVIKESYGNALVPFLCNNYEEVYVVDPRWIDMNLPTFVAANGINEVMAINYMFAIGNQTYCNAFSKMVY